MRENGIGVERSKKYKVTTDSNHAFNIAPNLLNRDFSANQPSQKWAGDISYVWTREGWLSLKHFLFKVTQSVSENAFKTFRMLILRLRFLIQCERKLL